MSSDQRLSPIKSFAEFYNDLHAARHEHYRLRLNTKVGSQNDFEEQRQHLLAYYKDIDVRHSFADDAGQIFDCVPIETQPALKKSGRPLAKPPTLPTSGSKGTVEAADRLFLSNEKLDSHGNVMACPPGTVPLRRLTLEELTRFENLEHFFRKSPKSAKKSSLLSSKPDSANASSPPHEYAHAYQQIANLGGHSILNIWSPTVVGSQVFSLSQQWYVATGNQGVQTAEVGWQVFPQKYGHGHPVLFTYWTADGYNNTGSYSTDANDFVQQSSSYTVGMALAQTSIMDGDQAEIEVSFYLENGNWWLFINGNDAAHAIGYYPATQYQNGPMATGASEIDYGGETVGAGSYPPMGSGQFAIRGYKQAAYHRNIYYFPPTGGTQDASLSPDQDWPNEYTISVQNSADWGKFFFFGGPGSSATTLALKPTVANGS
jgi:hypothetical protein